ncbi:MAG: hypothetical protein DWP94_00370 [Flavobacterium sp.]|nr:MAG: hypothetical protein DWP94_00370 [Flavobacterium sp.]
MLSEDKHIETFDFGVAQLYRDYILMEMNEGITVDFEINKQLCDYAANFYKDKPFGYITHRKNSYSVDPYVYIETSKLKGLVAFAIVSNKNIRRETAILEQIFLNKPLKTFKDLKPAISWVQGHVLIN